MHSFLVCGISNALDGSQDDLVSSDIPNIEDEDDESEGAIIIDEEDSSDVDSMGDPFSDDEDWKYILWYVHLFYTTSCCYTNNDIGTSYLVWSVVNLLVGCGKTVECSGQ